MNLIQVNQLLNAFNVDAAGRPDTSYERLNAAIERSGVNDERDNMAVGDAVHCLLSLQARFNELTEYTSDQLRDNMNGILDVINEEQIYTYYELVKEAKRLERVQLPKDVIDKLNREFDEEYEKEFNKSDNEGIIYIIDIEFDSEHFENYGYDEEEIYWSDYDDPDEDDMSYIIEPDEDITLTELLKRIGYRNG